MSNSIPEISIIACHHKGDFIFEFIDSVRTTTEFRGQRAEIIVVTSDEALADKGISDCQVFYNTGLPTEKRNLGVRVSRGKYIGFFDDDVIISPNCLKELKRALAPKDVGMTYGKLWNMEHRDRFDEAGGFITSTGFIWSRAGQNDLDAGQFDKEEPILAGKSASCMIKRDVFNNVGGFDEDFGILGEETDLSWRVWLSGRQVLFVPSATGYHAFNTKFKPATEYYTSKRVHYNGCRNYITMLIKNLGWGHLCIIPIHIGVWFCAAIAMLITGKASQGLNIFRGLFYVLVNLRKILTKRKSIQERRVHNESDIWPLIHRATPRGYYTQRFCRYISLGLHG